jgi:hypothetical protein
VLLGLTTLFAGCLNSSVTPPPPPPPPPSDSGPQNGDAATDAGTDGSSDDGRNPEVSEEDARFDVNGDVPIETSRRDSDPSGDVDSNHADADADANPIGPDADVDVTGPDTDGTDGSPVVTPDVLGLARWTTQQGAFDDAGKWLAGDFDGDGTSDLAEVFLDVDGASIDVRPSTGAAFGIERWSTRQGGFWDAQKWLAGDFDGDGTADLANVFADADQISIDVHLSAGDTFTFQRWATRQGGFWDAQKWLAGDFDGDGRTDLANIFDDFGQISIDVHLSTGSAFKWQRWESRQGGFWDAQKWLAGDFDGNGTDDLVNVFEDSGQASIDLHRSAGASFTFERWGTRQGGFWDAQKWLAGDFDGDGTTDLAVVFDDLGQASIDAHRSTGSSFTFERWATRQGGFWDAQRWLAGDFDGDGTTDLANVFDDQSGISIDVHRKPRP